MICELLHHDDIGAGVEEAHSGTTVVPGIRLYIRL
jgi:hypothetical protein